MKFNKNNLKVTFILFLSIFSVFVTSGELYNPLGECPDISDLFQENESGFIFLKCEGMNVGYAKPQYIRFTGVD